MADDLGADLGARAWAAALDLVGVRFRLHGRDVATGLDCVGLVAAAYRVAGFMPATVPDRYRLAGPAAAVAQDWLLASGLRPVRDAVRPGDVALLDMGGVDRGGARGRAQLHLMLLAPDAAIHAHAGLRRVVVMPGSAPGTLLGRWRVVSLNGE